MKLPALFALADEGQSKRILSLLMALMLLFAGAAALSLIYVNRQTVFEKELVRAVAEQSFLSQKLKVAVVGAISKGDPKFIPEVTSLRNQINQNLEELESNFSKPGLLDVSKTVNNEFRQVNAIWQEYRKQVDFIVQGHEAALHLRQATGSLTEPLSRFIAVNNNLLKEAVQNGVSPEIFDLLTQALMVAERMASDVDLLLRDADIAEGIIERLGHDIASLNTVTGSLLNGNMTAGSVLVKPQLKAKLGEFSDILTNVRAQTNKITERMPEIHQVIRAARAIRTMNDEIHDELARLEKAAIADTGRLDVLIYAAYGFGLLSLIALLLISYFLNQKTRIQLNISKEQGQRNEQAILRLLDEISRLAEGDLTTHINVTEDMTGAIADSINYAIDSLRRLVTTINYTAERVSSAAQSTQMTAQKLADSSIQQANEITSTSAAVSDIANSIQHVSRHALNSAEVARKSVTIAHTGSQKVSRTIDGMHTIREQIQETSKRIKRLGESSQEIGDIVSLINEVADQTNILALNAAIQAATAGEAGRGFAVVADEVQRLAERASNATKQIEVLVRTIQADTREAITSMEQSTTNVVSGAKLAEDAGGALTEIESVSNNLSKLIQAISEAAAKQADAAINIKNTMGSIQNIAKQTSQSSRETATDVSTLNSLASELRDSVQGFRLPESKQEEQIDSFEQMQRLYA